MNEKIGVVNWFTKKPENVIYPEQSEEQLDLLSNGILHVFNSETQLNKAADKIYEIILNSDFLKKVCSDSRLPVCSLFHHLKNTSGIAVCLMMQKMDVDENYIQHCLAEYGIGVQQYNNSKDFKGLVRIASLLHDLGKLRSYTNTKNDLPFYSHQTQTKEILESILEKSGSQLVEKYDLKKILPQLAANHHSKKGVNLTQLERLISNADSVASASDRKYEINVEFNDNNVTVESRDKFFPHQLTFNTEDVRCLDSKCTEKLVRNESISKRVEDISDESKSTIKLFEDSIIYNGGSVHFKGQSKTLSGRIGLLALDTMGIQDFINEAEKLPMLRGGSNIVSRVLIDAKKIISGEICEEAILFADGGNLLSFIPDNNLIKDNLTSKIKTMVIENSKGGLEAAVVMLKDDVSIDDVANNFGDVLIQSQKELDVDKNKTRIESSIPNKRKICLYCFKRPKPDSSEMCEVCKNKMEEKQTEKTNQEYIPYTHKLRRPSELVHIGSSIAVLLVDGNMMGRLFQQTLTPAEYTYKSETFTTEFKSIIKDTIKEFVSDKDQREKLIQNTYEHNNYLGFDVIYVGGDDALIIMNAKGVLPFAEKLINNVSEKFYFKHDFSDGTIFENPTVTISCGIAIADNHFPIYFLLDAAREMESKAKAEFRNEAITDDSGYIKSPTGALAVTAVSSAMPTGEFYPFVLKSDYNNKSNLKLKKLISLLDMAIDKKRIITEIVTCGTGEIDRLNLLKSMYASIHRKGEDFGLDECEKMAEVLLDNDLLNAMRMLTPHIWHREEIENENP